jgi:hypothetical protein
MEGMMGPTPEKTVSEPAVKPPSDADVIVDRIRRLRRHARVQSVDRILRVVFAALVTVELIFLGFQVYTRWDLTLVGAFTVSDKTVRILSELTEPIKVTVFYSGNYPPHRWTFPRVHDLLEVYERASGKIELEFVDPYKNRVRAGMLRKKFKISEMDFAAGVVVFTYKGQSKFVPDNRIVVRRQNAGSPAGQGRPVAFRGEEAFLSTILSLVEGRKPLAYILEGHLEASPEDSSPRGFAVAADRLRRDNYEVRSLTFRGEASVPEDCDVLIIPGPQTPFSKMEAYAVRNYLDVGGRVLLLLPLVLEKGTLRSLDLHIDPVLDYFSISSVDAIILDPSNPAIPNQLMRVKVTDYDADHPMTKPMLGVGTENKPVIFPFARPLKVAEKIPEGFEVRSVARTADYCVKKRDVEEIIDGEKFQKLISRYRSIVHPGQDEQGAWNIAVAGEKTGARADRQCRMVVVGNYLFASGQILTTETYNEDFFLNAVNWLTSRETYIGIAGKKPREISIRMKPKKMDHVFWLVIVLLPGAALSLGVFVWFLRRK